ncbi:hypothetical protein QQF64_021086 [Cirrhinus molitorella]|uniref:Uncharacterized protein n=1 Tax=Cirrhinus molitorella TaxID=172907 RepID=A0ABR3LDA9_9TELE
MSLLQRVSVGIRLMTGSALQSYSQWRSRRKLKKGAGVTKDANESMVRSPAPVVYGIVNDNLLLSLSLYMCTQSQFHSQNAAELQARA